MYMQCFYCRLAFVMKISMLRNKGRELALDEGFKIDLELRGDRE